ncbi:MAG: hypothetical protein QW739_05235, partial [Candidatus Odinarchaeota archaeon]
NSALSIAYYLRILGITVFSEPSEKVAEVKESPIGILIPIAILAVAIFILGVWNTPILDLIQQVAYSVLNPASYIGAVVP